MDVMGPPPEGAPTGPDPDLSPRRTTDVAAVSGAPKRRKGWGAGLVLALVLGAGGFLLYQGLSSATVYFCNADEVGHKAGCGGSGRFRLQGMVDNGSVVNDDATVRFTVTYNGATIPVTYQGQPGGIFREGIPVVVEGRMAANGFAGDRILVKHTEQYVAKNPGRVPAGAP